MQDLLLETRLAQLSGVKAEHTCRGRDLSHTWCYLCRQDFHPDFRQRALDTSPVLHAGQERTTQMELVESTQAMREHDRGLW